jgi:hypothetical protein
MVVLSLFKSRLEPPLSGAERLAGIACVALIAFYGLFFLVMKRLSYGIQLQFQEQKARSLTDALRQKPYAFGSTIRFCSGCRGFDRIGLLVGWSYSESWGTWTDGAQANVILQLSLPIREELQLVGRMVAITDGRRPQQVEVVVNGQNIERWTFNAPGLNERRALIPPNVAALRQPMLITFNIPHPVAPSTISWSDDHRLLGIGMEELRIDEKGRARK